MRPVQRRKRYTVHAGLVVGVVDGRLSVHQGQESTRLQVGLRIVGMGGSFDDAPGKVSRHEDPRLSVEMPERRSAADAGPGIEPVQVGVNLPLDVPVALPGRLHDESRPCVVQLENESLDRAELWSCLDDRRKPSVHEPALSQGECWSPTATSEAYGANESVCQAFVADLVDPRHRRPRPPANPARPPTSISPPPAALLAATTEENR